MFLLLLSLIAAGFAVLAVKDLRMALVVLAGLLPTYLLRFNIGPVPGTLFEVLILIAAAVWIFKYQGYKINVRSFDPITRALLLLLAAASFGVVAANDTLAALGIWKAYFIEPFLVYLMMRAVFQKNDWKKALVALAISGMVVSLFAFFQFTTGLGLPSPWDLERRVTGLFDYPNALGLFLAPIVGMSAVLSLSPATKERRGRTHAFWVLSALLGTAAIVLAKTEAAYVAIPAGLFLAFIFSGASKKKKMLASICTGVILVVALLVPVSRSKLLLEDYSGQVRLSQWSETIAYLKTSPFAGAGLSGYPDAIAPFHDPTMYEIFQYPHNIFLNIWVELGLLGLIAFAWLAWLVLKSVLPNSTTQPLNHSLLLAAFCALAIMTIHGLVDVPYFKNDLAVMTWFFLAALSATRETRTPPRLR